MFKELGNLVMTRGFLRSDSPSLSRVLLDSPSQGTPGAGSRVGLVQYQVA